MGKTKWTNKLHKPCKLRLLLHQKENTLSGLEDPSLLPSPPSKICGSRKTNMTNLVLVLSTENAHKLNLILLQIVHLNLVITNLLICSLFLESGMTWKEPAYVLWNVVHQSPPVKKVDLCRVGLPV